MKRAALRRPIALACLCLGLSACFSLGHKPSPEEQALRRAIVLDALGQIGRPYIYGGTTPRGFDCSGLVQYVYRQQGIQVPRTARAQHKASEKLDLDDALPGDLLFYKISGWRVDHVAIYLGDGQAVHAPSSGKHVIVAPISNKWWKKRYVGAGRLID